MNFRVIVVDIVVVEFATITEAWAYALQQHPSNEVAIVDLNTGQYFTRGAI